jgi:hypothetical protein
MLCTPRAVTRKRAAELDANAASCKRGRSCPEPLCRPPRERHTLACVESRCVAKVSPGKSDD